MLQNKQTICKPWEILSVYHLVNLSLHLVAVINNHYLIIVAKIQEL